MRRGLAPALLALACLGCLPATALAAPGDIAVSDEGNWMGSVGRVLNVDPAGAATPLASGAPLLDPWAVAVAGDGALLVVDEGAESIFRVTPSGTVSTVASGPALQDPVGIALGPDGKAYVSDRQRDAILRLDLASGVLTVVANLIEPRGLAMDNAGKLIVADGRALRRVDPGTGAVTTVADGAPLVQPRDVAVQLDGTLYAVGERQVVRVDPASGAKTVLASDGLLNYPSAIDIDPDGDLVVTERGGAAGVLHVDRETGATSLLANGPLLTEPTGIATVGGAGVDASGGGNGDPDGPAAPPDPPEDPGTPAGPGTPGTPGGAGGTGGITVTLPDGTVITLPPGVTPATSGIRGVDFTAPSFVRKPKLSATRFRAARRGRAFASAFPIGTSLSWLLNEPARVTVTVQRYQHLSRVCRRKLAKQSRHRTGTRCRRWISMKGRYSKASLAGISSVRFRGRLNRKTLKPGRYRFVIRARDGAGNVSRPRRPGFRIVR